MRVRFEGLSRISRFVPSGSVTRVSCVPRSIAACATQASGDMYREKETRRTTASTTKIAKMIATSLSKLRTRSHST